MKLCVVFVTVICLGSSWAHPGWLSSLSSTVADTGNAMRQTAINTAKATTNTAVNAAKATTNTAISAAKATTNTAVSAAKATSHMAMTAAETAKNVTVNTAMAGVNMVKDISLGAMSMGIGVLISAIKGVVRKTGKNTIAIPDIAQDAGPIHFRASKGYFKDITTLVQAGKANMTMSGASIKIDLPLKLETIDIGYDQFNVTMLKMNIGGGIKIHIKNDTFVVHLRLTPGFTCAMNVEKVEVTVLTGFEIDFTNMGKKSEWLLEKASNMIVSAVKSKIKSKVQEAMDTNVKAALKEDSSICSKFLG